MDTPAAVPRLQPNEVTLRVASRTSVSSLASAISNAVYDGKEVTLRAVGAGAVNQAVKSIAVAGAFVAPRGLTLSCRPGFKTVEIEGEEVSAIILRVFSH